MGGKSTSQTETKQTATTNPWEPAVAPLTNIIGQLGGQVGNTGINSTEAGAYNALEGNATNPYAGGIANLAQSLLSGPTDFANRTTTAYDNLSKSLAPTINGDYLDITKNPLYSTLTNDITNQVNGMFAGAGRDLSGANQQALARGLAQGLSPLYSQERQNQLGAIGSLYDAGNNTTGILSNLSQSGIGAAESALGAQNYGPLQLLNIEAQKRGAPVQNLGDIAGILGSLAQLGGTTNQTGTSNGVNQMSGAQQFALLGSGVGGFGKFLFG